MVAREASPNTDVFSGHRSRVALLWLGAAFGIVFLLALVGEALAPGAADRQPGRNSWSYDARGFRAFYEVLETLGYRLERFRRTYRALPPGEESVLLAIDPGSLEAILQARSIPEYDDPGALVREWVEGGGRLVITRPGDWQLNYGGFDVRLEGGDDLFDVEREEAEDTESDGTLRSLLEDLPGAVPRSLPSTVETRSPLEELTGTLPRLLPGQARALGVYMSGEASDSIDVFEGVPADAEELVSAGGEALAFEYTVGKGRIVCVSTAFPFTNGALKWTPSVEVLTELLHHVSERGRRRILFDEFTHGFYRRSGLLRWARETALFYPLATILISVLIAAWYGAVRFGPVRSERELSRRAREEYVLSLGDMYRRGRHYDHVLALVVEAYETRLSRLVGSESSGSDVETRRAIDTTSLARRAVSTEEEFLREARRLHQEYITLVHAVRGKEDGKPPQGRRDVVNERRLSENSARAVVSSENHD